MSNSGINRQMSKRVKICLAIIAALIITIVLSRSLFSSNSPRTNQSFISSIPRRVASFVSTLFPKPTPTPAPIILITSTPSPTGITGTPTPTKKIAPAPTTKPTMTVSNTPVPTVKPTVKPSPVVSASCPTTSQQSYQSISASGGDNKLRPPLENHPEVNLRLRGFVEVNEGTNLISRNGSTYGLDNQMPPQISSLFGTEVPKIAKTYRIYEWDFQNNKSGAPQTATPAYPVHMLGLQATPGKPLLGLKAGRDIGGGNVFMVLYATKNDIMFTHSNGDNLDDGYLFYFLDICVDPNLLSAYQSNSANGRSQLPVIAPGQIFGYAGNTDVKIVVRDTMSFMDTRYKEDWWFYGQ